MEFHSVDKVNQTELAPFFAAQRLHNGDFSLGFQFMWYEVLKPSYAIVENCLVLREYYTQKHYFHYPISLDGNVADELRAVDALEEYCRENYIRLHLTNVPKSRIADMVVRYGACQVTNNRRWRDYLYHAADFKDYPGKQYAGQRNHVHKFEKLYPDWQYFEVTASDMGRVSDFLKEYEEIQRGKHDRIAEEEMDEVYALLPHMEAFGIRAGVLTVGDKIVGFSAGERCGDMFVVHIEKALREYEGAYPTLAQQTARLFCGEGVDYVNRMDDAGDLGLRKSKLQYRPCELVDKFNVIPKRAIDLVSRLPHISTERLTLQPVSPEDADSYARLVTDEARNRYWGEAWGMPKKARSNARYLKAAQESFRKRWEMPLGIYVDGELAGEVLLHTFGYRADAEIGVRLLPGFEGKGYAQEAVRAYTDYAFSKLNVELVRARCYKENARSRAMLTAAGMRETGGDETYYFFTRTPVM